MYVYISAALRHQEKKHKLEPVKSFLNQVVFEEGDLTGSSKQNRLSLPSSQWHAVRCLVSIDVKYAERAEYVVLIIHLKNTKIIPPNFVNKYSETTFWHSTEKTVKDNSKDWTP